MLIVLYTHHGVKAHLLCQAAQDAALQRKPQIVRLMH